MTVPDFVPQGETNECGLACIAMLAQTQNVDLPLDALRENHPVSSHGSTLAELCDILNKYQIAAYPVFFEHNELESLPLPAILHYGSSHYVVLAKHKGNVVCLLNPAIGQQIIPVQALKKEISGYALILDKESGDNAVADRKPLERKHFLSFLSLNETAKIKKVYLIMVITFLASLTLFIMPLMVGMAINSVFASKDVSAFHWQYYLLAFVAGTLIAFGVRVLTERIIKRFLLVKASAGFSKLLSNRQDFFDKRAPGEIYSRFNSWQIALAQKLELDNSLRSDWVIMLISLVIMYFISPTLALVSGVGITLTGAVSIWALFKDRDYTQQLEMRVAEQNDFVFETVQGISTIKAAGLESIRRNGFAQYAAELFTVLQKQKVYQQVKDGLYQLIGSLEMVIFMLVALPLVADGRISMGSFFAYSFIRQIFTSYVTRIFYGIIQKNHIHVIDKRADDLFRSAAASRECSATTRYSPVQMTRDLQWREVNYYYSAKKEIIPPTSFRLQSQQCIAILGASGAGKTTFLRLLAGLIEPRSGEMTVDGQPVNSEQLQDLVFLQSQEDIIFNSSVIENITLFDSQYEDRMRPVIENIVAGLQLTEVLDELPGGLNGMVRESHCELSLGQRQRLLLARALYSKRQVILLDEPTANLDETTVTDVMQWVIRYCKQQHKTLVVVTHNEAIVPLFDGAYRMNDGRLRANEQMGTMLCAGMSSK